MEVIFKGTTNVHIDTDTKFNSATTGTDSACIKQRPYVSSTCRTLQRKLELKVERAKRNYNQYHEVNVSDVSYK